MVAFRIIQDRRRRLKKQTKIDTFCGESPPVRSSSNKIIQAINIINQYCKKIALATS